MRSLIREREKSRGRERSGAARWTGLAAKAAAVACAALLLAGGCDEETEFYGLSGSPDGVYNVLYSPEKSGSYRFFLAPGTAAFAGSEAPLFSDELGSLPANSYLYSGSGLHLPVEFSPDNKFLAYVNESTGNYEVHELDLATMHNRVLFPHPAKDDSPSYSPDGKYLAFISYRSGQGEIWLNERATGALKQLTHDQKEITLARFIANGKIIFYYADDEENANILDLESGEARPFLKGALEPSFSPRHGLVISAREDADGQKFTKVFLYGVDRDAERELGFSGELASFSLPFSPDGKWFLAASKLAVEALPLDGGPARSFPIIKPLAQAGGVFMAWMEGGDQFRVIARNAQFTGSITGPARTLTPRDKFALSMTALSELAAGRDKIFHEKMQGLESLPDPVKRDDDDAKKAMDLARVIDLYAAGDYARAAEIWKDSKDARSRVLGLYIGLTGKSAEEFNAARKKFIEEPSKSDDEVKRFLQPTDFVAGLAERQARAFMKYQKTLTAEQLDVMACDLSGSCRRKLAPRTKLTDLYIKLHPRNALSGYLSLEIADVCGSYGDTAGHEKYLKLASKSPDHRLQSLAQLSSFYQCHDPAAALKFNETIMAEYPGTKEAKEAREEAGKYWLKQGDDGKAYDLLTPLVLDSDSAALWQALQEKSPEDFRGLVLAQYTDDDAAEAERLAKVAERQPDNGTNQLLLEMSEKLISYGLSSARYDKTHRLSPALEKLLLSCILNVPSSDTNGLSALYFYSARRNEPAADIGSRWAGYAAAHPALAKTYAWFTLQGMLQYDQHDYAAARADFEQALSMLGTEKDKLEDEKKMTEEFILICLARESSKELIPRLAATVSKDSREVYDYTLATNLHNRPLPEISAFYLAFHAAEGGGVDSAYQLLECRAGDEELKKTARDFTVTYHQSPLTAAVLFALDDYDAVIQRFPDSLAGYMAMQLKAVVYDANANYWLAAGLWEKILGHPLLDKEGKSDTLSFLGGYEFLNARDYRKAADYLGRSWKENPKSKNGKDTLVYLAESWFELKDFAKARETLAILDREYPVTSNDKLDQIRKELAAEK